MIVMLRRADSVRVFDPPEEFPCLLGSLGNPFEPALFPPNLVVFGDVLNFRVEVPRINIHGVSQCVNGIPKGLDFLVGFMSEVEGSLQASVSGHPFK